MHSVNVELVVVIYAFRRVLALWGVGLGQRRRCSATCIDRLVGRAQFTVQRHAANLGWRLWHPGHPSAGCGFGSCFSELAPRSITVGQLLVIVKRKIKQKRKAQTACLQVSGSVPSGAFRFPWRFVIHHIRFHSPRLCRIAVLLIQTNVSL